MTIEDQFAAIDRMIAMEESYLAKPPIIDHLKEGTEHNCYNEDIDEFNTKVNQLIKYKKIDFDDIQRTLEVAIAKGAIDGAIDEDACLTSIDRLYAIRSDIQDLQIKLMVYRPLQKFDFLDDLNVIQRAKTEYEKMFKWQIDNLLVKKSYEVNDRINAARDTFLEKIGKEFDEKVKVDRGKALIAFVDELNRRGHEIARHYPLVSKEIVVK